MKRGLKTLIFGVVMIVGAVLAPMVVLVPLFMNQSQEEQFLVPGTTEVEIAEPGKYYLWNDYETLFQGTSYRRSKELPDGMVISIKDEDGKDLELKGSSSASSSSGSHSKQSVGTVEVAKPGKLVISVTGDFEQRVFSFSQFGMETFMWMFFGGFGVAVILGMTGLGFLIWGIIKLVRPPAK